MYKIYVKSVKRRTTAAIIGKARASNSEAGCELNGSSHSTKIRQSPLDCVCHRHYRSTFHTFVDILYIYTL
jgi:hypothetical protein